MGQVSVYSESTKDHRYVIVRDMEDCLFFLMVDDNPYLDRGYLFKAPFCEVLERMQEPKASEGLKTMS